MSLSNSNEVMKFVNVRGPQRIADVGPTILVYIRPSGNFDSKLRKIAEAGNVTRTEVRQRAIAIEEATKTVIDERILNAVRSSLRAERMSKADAITAIQLALGTSLTEMIESDEYIASVHGAWERLYCRAVRGKNVDDLMNRIRASSALESLLEGDASDDAPQWSDVLEWRPVVPKILFPAIEKSGKSNKKAEKLVKKVEKLYDEMELIKKLEPKIAVADSKYFTVGGGAKVTAKENKVSHDFSVRELGVGFLGTDIADEKGSLTVSERNVEDPPNWLLSDLDSNTSNANLDDSEKAYLTKHRNLIVNKDELDAYQSIKVDLYNRISDAIWVPKHSLPHEVATDKKTMALMSYAKLPEHVVNTKGYPPPTASLSGTSERVHVLGVGDLIVVEEQIKRYEKGEIAHIENVMDTETRLRRHVRTTESENTITSELEESTEEEKSLQTTDRFELSRESQKELESSLEITAGTEISGGYGPVTVKANAGITSSSSSSESNSTSQTIARESISKAVSKISKRVREEEVARVLKRIEETNEHGFKNESGKHISGVYRWVDKYHVVRAVNYGRRLMLEMIVPEPANGLRYAEGMHVDEGDLVPPPPAISFGPSAITRQNYLAYARIYKTGDVPPPPMNVKYVTANVAKSGGNENQHMVESEKTVTIPVGYKTTNIYDNWNYADYSGKGLFSFFAGSKSLVGNTTTTLDGVVGSLTLSASLYGASYNLGVRIRCEATREALEQWKVDVWDALNLSYSALVSEYEEKLAARSITELTDHHGRHPDRNRGIIRNELRRTAVKYLSEDMGEIIVDGQVRTDEQFNAADSTGDFSLTEARIEGSIIQFFEQAFEWHNMTWTLFPYFWSKASRQHEKLLAENDDAAMQDFLSAGAARVVVPTPVEYEDAVLNFFETNEIWNGGEPPTLDDDNYVSIVEELKKGRTNSFNSPIYYESANTPPPFILDEWEVKLPTSLVQLQDDSVLPTFPIGLHETNAPALLDEAAQRTGGGENWRNSIVDLMTLYGVAESDDEGNRRTFAESNGYSGDSENDAIASIDSWSYFWILNDVDLNGMPETQ